MSVLTIIAAIGAHPIETIEAFLDSFNKVAARDDRVGHFAEFCAWVTVKINRHIPLVLKGQVVAKFALFTLFTDTCLEIRAQSSLFVNLTVLIGLHLNNSLEKRSK